jgi:putative copper resistance protein D
MTEPAIVIARFGQFLGAAILFGAPLFFVYGLRGAEARLWPRDTVALAAAALAVFAALALSAQTLAMVGEPGAAWDPASLWSVGAETQFGRAVSLRIAAAVAALLISTLAPPGRGLSLAVAGVGGVALASFAWSGHGAADDGALGVVHLAADVAHLLAAGVWLGALLMLLLLLRRTRSGSDTARRQLHGGLAGFSGIGAGVVAVLLLTGLVNSWLLVGPAHVAALFSSLYGGALIAKLGLFGLMLGLAALNRFRLTPQLEADIGARGGGAPVHRLRASLLIEAAAGVAAIALVSLLGTLEPPASMG